MGISNASTPRGFVLSMFMSWVLLLVPVVREMSTLHSDGDRSTHMIAVFAVAFYGVPLSAIMATLLLPAHMMFASRGIRTPLAYAAWGAALLVLALVTLVTMLPKDSMGPADLPRLTPIAIGAGAIIGGAFWFGAVVGKVR